MPITIFSATRFSDTAALPVEEPQSFNHRSDSVLSASHADVFVPTSTGVSRLQGVGNEAQPSRKVRVFYRYGKTEEIQGLIKSRGLTFDNVMQYVDNDANLKGDGIYLAESPMTAQMYGTSVAEVWVDQDLIDDGHFRRFGGIGGDWWLGEIDDILEAEGLNLEKVASGAYRRDASKEMLLKNIGVYYRPFKGSQLSRKEMETLIKYSDAEMKPFFQQVLDDRMYLWQRGPNGRLTATEFTDDGFEIGPLAQKYCTEANRKNFVSYPNTETNDELVSDDYRGLQPIGFKNDLKSLAKKSIVYRVWEGYKDTKAWVKSLFY